MIFAYVRVGLKSFVISWTIGLYGLKFAKLCALAGDFLTYFHIIGRFCYMLHVIVRKISGLPYFRTRAIASMYQHLISRGPLMNDKDSRVRLLTFLADPSPECMLSTRPWYRLAFKVS
jgi:hypothetical protein